MKIEFHEDGSIKSIQLSDNLYITAYHMRMWLQFVHIWNTGNHADAYKIIEDRKIVGMDE